MDNIEKNNQKEQSNKEKLSILKKEILNSLSSEFDISHETAEKLTKLKFETKESKINEFKKELNKLSEINQIDKDKILALTNDKLENLFNSIKWAEKLSNEESNEGLDIIFIEKDDAISKKIFPNLFEKSINPTNYKDQIIWFSLWSLDSIYSTSKLLYDIWAWLVKSPNHIYIILSWKWDYKNMSQKKFLIYFLLTIFIIVFFVIYFFIA